MDKTEICPDVFRYILILNWTTLFVGEKCKLCHQPLDKSYSLEGSTKERERQLFQKQLFDFTTLNENSSCRDPAKAFNLFYNWWVIQNLESGQLIIHTFVSDWLAAICKPFIGWSFVRWFLIGRSFICRKVNLRVIATNATLMWHHDHRNHQNRHGHHHHHLLHHPHHLHWPIIHLPEGQSADDCNWCNFDGGCLLPNKSAHPALTYDKKIQKTKYKKNNLKKNKQNTTGATLMEALEATSSTYPGIWYKLILFCFIHNFKRRENMKPCSCYATDQQILKRKDNQMIANGATLMEAASCQTNLNPPHFRYWWLKQNDFFAVLWFW